ncbi:MAG: enoyl-CoA hydratase-related protein [Actinomycetota bacterium]
MTSTVVVEHRDAVQFITLNRPEVFNAFNDEMGAALLAALGEADDASVRAVVITGTGKAFCAGEDLRALSADYAAGKAPDLADIIRRRYNPVILAIQSLPKPVVAAVNGVAAGAGVSLALACDYRIMSEHASLVLAFSKVGLVPDSGGTWLLPKYLGVGRALELALSGDVVTAQRALELGLVNQVVASEKIAGTAGDFATNLATGPTLAYGMIKRLVWDAASAQLANHLESEAQAQSRAGSSADHLEGVNAFLEKRPPGFKGA